MGNKVETPIPKIYLFFSEHLGYNRRLLPAASGHNARGGLAACARKQ